MTSNTVCVTGEIDNVDFTREDGTSVTMLIPPDTPVGTAPSSSRKASPSRNTGSSARPIQDALADHGEEL